MLLELTEVLRCPKAHEESFLVCVTYAVEGSRVIRGVVGCPVCQAEFPVVDEVVDFRDDRTGGPSATRTGGASDGPLTAEAAMTFLGLRGPGGYLLLAGSASRLAEELAAQLPGVHVVCVNAPAGAPRTPSASYLLADGAVPLKSSWMRGVVLGADCAAAPWPAEGARLLLDGLRLAIEREDAEVPGVAELARGAGVSVWEKRSR